MEPECQRKQHGPRHGPAQSEDEGEHESDIQKMNPQVVQMEEKGLRTGVTRQPRVQHVAEIHQRLVVSARVARVVYAVEGELSGVTGPMPNPNRFEYVG